MKSVFNDSLCERCLEVEVREDTVDGRHRTIVCKHTRKPLKRLLEKGFTVSVKRVYPENTVDPQTEGCVWYWPKTTVDPSHPR